MVASRYFDHINVSILFIYIHSFQVCSTFTSFFFIFKVGLAHCALEVMPTCVSWDKGRAAIYILRKKFGVNWSGQGLIREINRSRWADFDKNILPTFSSLISWVYHYQEFRSDPLLAVIFQGKGDICWGWCHRWGCNESIEGKFSKDIAVSMIFVSTMMSFCISIHL